MSGTHLFYNGVLMRDCQTLEWNQAIEYDESHTDVLYSRVRITVVSTLIGLFRNPEDNQPTTDGTRAMWEFEQQNKSTVAVRPIAGETIVDRLQEIQSLLSKPRKDFWYALNAVTSNRPPADHVPYADYTQVGSYRVVLAATGLDQKIYNAVKDQQKKDAKARLGELLPEGNVSGPLGQKTRIEKKRVIDCNNGPKPISVSVVAINGGQNIRVQFTIEVCRPFTTAKDDDPAVTSSVPLVRDAGDTSGKGVISNRWKITEELDQAWQTSLAIEGTLVVSDHRFKPDAMRLMTSCALFPYAQLQRRQFAYSADGLTMKYRYEMRETGVAPPPGVVDWSGKYVEKRLNGGHDIGELSVKVRGAHAPAAGKSMQEHKMMLRDWLWIIINSRITLDHSDFNPMPGTNPESLVVLDTTFIENLREPEVEARVSVRYANKDFKRDYGLRLNNMGKPIFQAADYDEKFWPVPPAYPWDVATVNKGNPEAGTVYDQYFQVHQSEWNANVKPATNNQPVAEFHGKPRGVRIEWPLVARSEIKEQKQTDPGDTGRATALSDSFYQFDTPSGVPGLTGDPPPDAFAKHGFSDEQLKSGFTYIHVDIDNRYSRNAGKVAIPLSAPRNTANGQHTISIVQLHAGITFRRFTMVATRAGKWPKIPAPVETIVNSSTGVPVEYLLESEVIPEAPKLQPDGVTLEYSVQCKWTYALSRQPDAQGDNSAAFKASSDPRDKTSAYQNLVPIKDLYDYSNTLYG